METTCHQLEEEQFRQVVEMAPSAMIMIDKDGLIELVNLQAEKTFGYTRAELLGQSIDMLLPERFRTLHPQHRRTFFESPRPRAMGGGQELFARRKDNSEFPVEIGLNPIKTSLGVKVLSAIVDISERKLQEQQFRQVVEMAPNAMIMIDKRGLIELANLQAEKTFGYARAELIGQPIDMLLPERFRTQHPHLRNTFFTNPQPRAMGVGQELFARRKDGSEFPVEIGLNPIVTATEVKVLSAIVNISERKLNEKRLHESDEKFRVMIDSAKDYAFIMLSTEGCIISWNLGAERIYGYKEHEVIGKHISLFFTPEDIANGKPEKGLRFAASQDRFEDDDWRVRSNGKLFFANIAINAVRDKSGKLQSLVKMTRDITQHKHEEELIMRANQRFTLASSAAGIGFWDYDIRSNTMKWDKQMSIIYGRPQLNEEQPFSLWYDTIHPDDLEANKEALTNAINGVHDFDTEFRIIRPSDEIRNIRSQAYILRDMEGHAIKMFGVNFDITQHKQSELRQQQYIAELTRINDELNNFAYVSSHDLKTPLRGIFQLATWIEDDLGDSLNQDTQNHLRLMRNRIKRMETLLDDLLAYSRVGRTNDDIEEVNTHDLVQDIFDLASVEKSIKLELSDDLPVLMTRRVPLALVFRNLISNAIKHNDKPKGTLKVTARRLGKEIEFSVIDEGPGIPPKHQQRVFAMFQTLKPRDEVEGSGIGLALVKKAVETVGGKVTLESDGKSGCTFRFLWPEVMNKMEP